MAPKTVILEEVEAILKAFLLSCFGLKCAQVIKKKVEKVVILKKESGAELAEEFT